MDLKKCIRSIAGFPKAGIVFRDITPLLRDPEALRETVGRLAKPFADDDVDLVLSAEARGFILGPAVALKLGAGFVPIRKPGKLPAETVEETYDLEYGTDTLAMHLDAIEPGQRVLMLDDLLATGGTIAACCRMAEQRGSEIVGCAFLIELSFLGGREKFSPYRVVSLIDYASEDED